MELMQGIGIAVLGLVFALAALAKLTDREGTRQGLIEFGVPIGLAGWGSRMLPLVESAIALAILVRRRRGDGSGAAAACRRPAGWRTRTRSLTITPLARAQRRWWPVMTYDPCGRINAPASFPLQ